MGTSYMISGEVGHLRNTEINIISLMQNETLPDTLFIGFGLDNHEKVDKDNSLVFKVIVAVRKKESSSLSLEPLYHKGLKIHSYESLCYYCSSKIQDPAPCVLDMTLKTWGGYNEISAKTQVHSKMIISELQNTFKADLKGGSAYELSYGFHFFFSFILLLPLIGPILIPLGHNYRLFDLQSGDFRERSIFLTTRVIFYTYAIFTINMVWLSMFGDNSDGALFMPALLVLIIMANLVASFYVLPYSILLINNFIDFLSENTSDFGPLPCFTLLIFTLLYLVITIFLPFKNFIFTKSAYAFLTIPLLANFILNFAKKTRQNDQYIHLIVAAYITLIPFTPYGPFYFSSADYYCVVAFFVSQVALVTLIRQQGVYGSRFILPDCFRRRYYDIFKFRISVLPSEQEAKETCGVCKGLLAEPGVEDQNTPKPFKFARVKDEPMICYRLLCGHKFHQKCILEGLKQTQKCPTCQKHIGKDYYMD
ncbi:unnamed protein product [Moneuplotes crassus]|uniref:RING-type domain-containing protein n=1 Tax=Euplotes crassus TaxID=5936 RepID=A0AAD1U155_EUPCR|nr:unnamed protein product [Moneuplotes crassus]